jgi:hypothetical protein
MHTKFPLLRSRLPVLLAVAFVALFLIVATRVSGNLEVAWRMLRIPPMPVSFADTRMVTYPIDCVLNGQDPYDRSACHPLNSVYNYPPIWLDLRYLGVTSRSSVAIGVILVAMYVGALLLLFTSRRWVSFAVVLAGVLSRPSLFAVERGNIDLAIFSLLVFGLFLGARRKPRARTFSDGLLVVLLTILKVYPVAAVAAFIRNRKGLRTAFRGCRTCNCRPAYHLRTKSGSRPREYASVRHRVLWRVPLLFRDQPLYLPLAYADT